MNPQTHPFVFLKVISAMLVSMLMLSCSETEKETNQVPENQSGELSLKKVVIALKANKNPQKMLTEKESLEAYLSDKLQRPVEVLIPTDSSVVLESFRNGTLDLGYLSSTDAARNLDQDTASILLIHLKNGSPHYQSVWLSLKDKKYQSIEEQKSTCSLCQSLQYIRIPHPSLGFIESWAGWF